jgi:hypothetical protein
MAAPATRISRGCENGINIKAKRGGEDRRSTEARAAGASREPRGSHRIRSQAAAQVGIPLDKFPDTEGSGAEQLEALNTALQDGIDETVRECSDDVLLHLGNWLVAYA